MNRLSWMLRSCVGATIVCGLLTGAASAAADATDARLEALQKQIAAMQHEISMLKRRPTGPAVNTSIGPGHQSRMARREEAVQGIPGSEGRSPAFLQAEALCEGPAIPVGHVCFTPGGFLELTGFYRNPNEAADIGSNFGGIPFRNSPLAHEGEFRFSARQSRISGLVTAMIDPSLKISAYGEADFLGAAVTSNNRESNSYVPRIRQLWAAFDDKDLGIQVLAGQAYTLMTTNLSGITATKEQTPLTIDAQFVPGFNWARMPQVRVVDNVAPGIWAAAALEASQTLVPGGAFVVPAGINLTNAGDPAGLNNSTTTYSVNQAPDVSAKLAFEPGWGHYEIKGIARWFNDRAIGHSYDDMGYGIGASATMPIVRDYLDLQLSGLFGRGIGRYGSAQLPDVALRADGSVVAIPMFQTLAGLIGHVSPGFDVYAYAGWEHAERTGALSLSGYGSPTLNNSGCDIEGALAATCQAESRDVKQIAGGFWHDVYKGSYGRVAAGGEVSYTTRDAFRGLAGVDPSAHMVIGLASLRYYPF